MATLIESSKLSLKIQTEFEKLNKLDLLNKAKNYVKKTFQVNQRGEVSVYGLFVAVGISAFAGGAIYMKAQSCFVENYHSKISNGDGLNAKNSGVTIGRGNYVILERVKKADPEGDATEVSVCFDKTGKTKTIKIPQFDKQSPKERFVGREYIYGDEAQEEFNNESGLLKGKGDLWIWTAKVSTYKNNLKSCIPSQPTQ